MAVTKEDYKMIETMNNLAKQKYSEMAYLAENANTLNASLQLKCTVSFLEFFVYPKERRCNLI